MKNTIYSSVIIFLFAGFLVVDPFFHQGIFKAHDIPSNLTYFAAFYSSLTEGNIVPRWGGNIANLYGSPTIMFFYPMTYYLSSLIRFFGFSFIDTTKIFIFISFIASAFFFYLWIKNHVPKVLALLGGLLYVYAPYRITDIYSRGSIAENTSFIFIPLVLLAVDKINSKPTIKNTLFLTLSLALLILSHPFMLVVFLPFYVLYAFCIKINYKKIFYCIFAGFLSILSTAFYIIPLLIENKYTHYDMSPFRGIEYHNQFLTFNKLIVPQWNFTDIYGTLEYQTYQIGLLQIALLLLATVIVFIFREKIIKNQKHNRFIFVGFTALLLGIFLTLPVSNSIYKLIPFLQRIEYPWRFLSLIVFSTAFLMPFIFSLLPRNIHKWIFVATIVFGIYFYLPYAKGHDYKYQTDSHYLYDIRINTDAFATLPRWASQPDQYLRVNNRYQVIEGSAQVTTLLRTSTRHIYEIESQNDTRFADSTFYFPGWNVYIDGKPSEIQFQDPQYRGIITFNVPRGKHLVEVLFKKTKVRWAADLISAITLITIFVLFINEQKIQKTINRYTGL